MTLPKDVSWTFLVAVAYFRRIDGQSGRIVTGLKPARFGENPAGSRSPQARKVLRGGEGSLNAAQAAIGLS